MIAIEASIGYRSDDFWSYVYKLLHLRWVILVSGFKRAKPSRKLLTIFLWLIALGVFVGSILLTQAFFRLLESPLIAESGINPRSLVEAIPVLVVSGVFLGILMTSFAVLLQALFLANDMDFLLAAPVPIRAVFLTKLLQAILPNFIMVMVIGLPVLYGLGMAGRYNILYFVLVLVVLGLLSLAAAGSSSLLVMAVVRFIPAKRVAEILAFLGAVFFMTLSQWSNLTGIRSGDITPELIGKTTQTLTNFNNAWSPLAWGGRGLVDIGEGRWLSGIIFLVLTFGLSAGVFWFALNTAERLYYSGWASIHVVAQHKVSRRVIDHSKTNGTSAIIRHWLPSNVWAMILKDFRVLQRDLRYMSQLVIPLIMGIVFAVMLLRAGGKPIVGKGDTPVWVIDLLRSAMAYGGMGISAIVGYCLVSNLTQNAFSLEGKNYWVIKTSPISAGELLVAKFLFAYLPSLTLSWLFLLSIALLQRLPSATIFYSFPCIALVLAGLGGINLTIGVRGANLNWTDPRHMSSGIWGLLGIIISFAYLIVTLLLFFGPPIGMPLLGYSLATGQLVGILAGGTVTLLLTFLPLWLVKERVNRIGEE